MLQTIKVLILIVIVRRIVAIERIMYVAMIVGVNIITPSLLVRTTPVLPTHTMSKTVLNIVATKQ